MDHLILAYIDPGSGSLIIQGVIAGLIAAPFFFRRQIRSFMDKVRGRGSEESSPVDTAEGQDQDAGPALDE